MLRRLHWRTNAARTTPHLTAVGRILRYLRIYDWQWLYVNDGTEINCYRAVWLPLLWPLRVRMVGNDLAVRVTPRRQQ